MLAHNFQNNFLGRHVLLPSNFSSFLKYCKKYFICLINITRIFSIKCHFAKPQSPFSPITYISTAWIQGSPIKIWVTDVHHYKTEDHLANEVNTNSLQEKTWKPRHNKLGPYPGLWLPGRSAWEEKEDLQKVVLKCPITGENCCKFKQHCEFVLTPWLTCCYILKKSDDSICL